MSYSVAVETFDHLAPSWSRLVDGCPGCPIFLTPQWHRTWWRHFGEVDPLLLAVRTDGHLTGVAPMMKTPEGISFLGSTNVCDYLDFVMPAEHAPGACRAIFDFLKPMDWKRLDFFALPADAIVRAHFLPLATGAGYSVNEEQEDVCPQRDLPSTWDEYLAGLDRTSRHELRRKMRRLSSQPDVAYEVVETADNLQRDMADFLRLFLESRESKTVFLTGEMEAFFQDVARMAAGNGWLRLFFLKVGNARVASAMVFEIGDTFYLYNSGYDKRYASLSVGLLLKAHCVEEAIARGKKRFDFLRGREPYKYDLGGIDRPVYRARVTRS